MGLAWTCGSYSLFEQTAPMTAQNRPEQHFFLGWTAVAVSPIVSHSSSHSSSQTTHAAPLRVDEPRQRAAERAVHALHRHQPVRVHQLDELEREMGGHRGEPHPAAALARFATDT